MNSCCQSKSCELEKIEKKQAKVLWVVLFVNLTMFFAETIGGIMSKSLSVSADSLDMLGDALAYGSSLYVISKGLKSKALSAMAKGVIMILTGLGVSAQAVYRVINSAPPSSQLMTLFTAAALAANVLCLLLLTRYRQSDINMSSVWMCSRNDIIANVAVLGAAGLVSFLTSPMPDLIVGVAITLLFLSSGIQVIRQARAALS
jgi:cation diffusion facilitator family transporter